MILIIDYESGNIRSISNALNFLDIKYKIVSSINEVDFKFTHIILPGVGSYNDAMLNLKKKNFYKFLIDNNKKQIPILGICAGMQILSSVGYENTITKGINLIKGEVKNIKDLKPDYKCHVGWNNIFLESKNRIFTNINLECEFYFDHSYYFQPSFPKNILCKSKYNLEFCSGVIENNLIGVQFHPEKSHKNGIMIYKNFYNLFNA